MSKFAKTQPHNAPTKKGQQRAAKAAPTAKKVVDSPEVPALDSLSNVAITPSDAPAEPPAGEQKTMTLTFKGLDKRGRSAIYTGAAISIRIGVSAFPDKKPAATIMVGDGALAGPKQKQERKKLTKEERAALPKPTLAERVARAEARTAALKAKLAEAGKPAEQPAL